MNHADRKIVAAVTLVLLLLASIVRGEDWKTTDGTTYQNVTVIHHDSTVVTVSYNNSTAPIASSDLSKAIFRGLIGTVTLPLSSLDKVIQQTVLNDHTTVFNRAPADGSEEQYDSAIADLCSQSPQVRSRSAEIIRTHHLYKPTPRDSWDKLAAGLKIGQDFRDVIDFLHKKGIAPLLSLDSTYTPHNGVYNFQLDDSWVISCAINNSLLTEYKVIEQPIEIEVSPPAQYTGYWHTYRINGESMPPVYYSHGIMTFLDAH